MSPAALEEILHLMALPKRRCFISYHHADEHEVRQFAAHFSEASEAFDWRGLGIDMGADIIASANTDYVMRAIRERYMAGTSVTLVMIGRCTWARRYVDWEIQASLRNTFGSPANGLLGIKLPSCPWNCLFPERLNQNLLPPNSHPWAACYAKWIDYPTSYLQLKSEIEAAYQRRSTHSHLIVNPSERFLNNRACL
jgi:hypothetical protein